MAMIMVLAFALIAIWQSPLSHTVKGTDMAERFRGINFYQNFFQNSHVMWVEAQEVLSMLGHFDITLLCYFSR
jgi:hypothetical protein